MLGLSFFQTFSWDRVYERATEAAVDFVLTHRTHFFYAGIAFSGLAVLCALIVSASAAIFCLLAAAALLQAAFFASRLREEKIARDLQDRNEELFHTIERINDQLDEEKKTGLKLFSLNHTLAETLKEKGEIISQLEEQNLLFFEENQNLKKDAEGLRRTNAEFAIVVKDLRLCVQTICKRDTPPR